MSLDSNPPATMNISTDSPENLTTVGSQHLGNSAYLRNKLFGALGILLNLAAVVMLWRSGRVRSSLKPTLISMAVSDLVFSAVAAIWGPHFPCWPGLYIITSTILVSYLLTVVLALNNYVAVFYPLRCNEFLSLRKCLIYAASCWLGGLLISLTCTDVHIPTRSICYLVSNMPRYGLITVSSVCLLCSCCVIIANVRTFMDIRRRSLQSAHTTRTPGQGTNPPSNSGVNTGSSRCHSTNKCPTRTNSVVPLELPVSPLPNDSRDRIQFPETSEDAVGLKDRCAPQRVVTRGSHVRNMVYLQVPTPRTLFQRHKHSATFSFESPVQNDIATIPPVETIPNTTHYLDFSKRLTTISPISLDREDTTDDLSVAMEVDGTRNVHIGKDIMKYPDTCIPFPSQEDYGMDYQTTLSLDVNLESDRRCFKPKDGCSMRLNEGIHTNSEETNSPYEAGTAEHTSWSCDHQIASCSTDFQMRNSKLLDFVSQQTENEMGAGSQTPTNVQRQCKSRDKILAKSRGSLKAIQMTNSAKLYLLKKGTKDDNSTVLLHFKSTAMKAGAANPLAISIRGNEHGHVSSENNPVPSTFSYDNGPISTSQGDGYCITEDSEIRRSDASFISLDAPEDTSFTSQNTSEQNTPNEETPPSLPELNKPRPAISTQGPGSRTTKRNWRQRTQNTLLLLCSMCCILSLPYVVYGGYVAIWVEDRISFTASGIGIFVSSLAALNSITNPLLYAWRFVEWPAFRSKLRNLRSGAG